jgi:uncharacterized membrane protein
MLVHFPVALWTVSAAADVVGRLWHVPACWPISFGCQALGSALALAAIVFGVLDYASIARSHPSQDTAVRHLLAMSAAWLMWIASLALRGPAPGAAPPIWATGVALAAWVVMAYGGWLGGKLVYHFGVGVQANTRP